MRINSVKLATVTAVYVAAVWAGGGWAGIVRGVGVVFRCYCRCPERVAHDIGGHGASRPFSVVLGYGVGYFCCRPVGLDTFFMGDGVEHRDCLSTFAWRVNL